jgi:hypothetical protein
VTEAARAHCCRPVAAPRSNLFLRLEMTTAAASLFDSLPHRRHCCSDAPASPSTVGAGLADTGSRHCTAFRLWIGLSLDVAVHMQVQIRPIA